MAVEVEGWRFLPPNAAVPGYQGLSQQVLARRYKLAQDIVGGCVAFVAPEQGRYRWWLPDGQGGTVATLQQAHAAADTVLLERGYAFCPETDLFWSQRQLAREAIRAWDALGGSHGQE